MRFYILFFALAFALTAEGRSCSFVYGPWGPCDSQGNTNRNISCLCDDNPVADSDLTFCIQALPPLQPEPTEQRCTKDQLICDWRWTKWSDCSESCGGGNATRDQICICQDVEITMPADYCDPNTNFGIEVVDCNNYECGETPSFNKLYWLARAEEGFWPMRDSVFNCSLGYEANDTYSPKGRHYSWVLRFDDPHSSHHPEWFFLAKEWIAAKLNQANKVEFSKESLLILENVARLLEKCDGWSSDDIAFVLTAKETLARLNNNIGGLEHVPDVVQIIINGYSSSSNEEFVKSGTIILAIGIPTLALLVIGVIVGVTVYYVREKKNAILEKGKFDSEDEESDSLEKAASPVKEMPNASTAGEKFESDSSDEH